MTLARLELSELIVELLLHDHVAAIISSREQQQWCSTAQINALVDQIDFYGGGKGREDEGATKL